jgi:arylsulfatase A
LQEERKKKRGGSAFRPGFDAFCPCLLNSQKQKPMKRTFFFLLSVVLTLSCQKFANVKSKNERLSQPNIILILVDDFGYELPQCDGGSSYLTPNINLLAQGGMRFTNFRMSPNCSPSRVALLTGLYNYRNYTAWGHLNTSNKTIANVLTANGYECAVYGKWQLDGGTSSILSFGFDASHDVNNPFAVPSDELGSRYKDPVYYSNYQYTRYSNNEYSDDINLQNLFNFEDTVSHPFFTYLSLSNVHVPFGPTPSDPDYATWDTSSPEKLIYFPEMVSYVDDLVGKIMARLPKNTIVIFTGDNGTSPNVKSIFNGILVHGDKETPNEFGTHVPLIFNGYHTGIDTNLIDVPDIYSTILDMAGIKQDNNDGVSFYKSLEGVTPGDLRTYSYCYWSPLVSPASTKRFEWVLGTEYKVFSNGKMYDYIKDPYDTDNIKSDSMTNSQEKIRRLYLNIIKSKHT